MADPSKDPIYTHHTTILNSVTGEPLIVSFFEGPQRFWIWYTIEHAEQVVEQLTRAINFAKQELSEANAPNPEGKE